MGLIGGGTAGGAAHLGPALFLGRRLLALALPDHLLLFAENLGQFGRVHRENIEFGQVRPQRGIVDSLRMQLLLEIFLQSHLLDLLHVARARTVAEAIEDVDDFLSLREGLVVRRSCSQGHQSDDSSKPSDQDR